MDPFRCHYEDLYSQIVCACHSATSATSRGEFNVGTMIGVLLKQHVECLKKDIRCSSYVAHNEVHLKAAQQSNFAFLKCVF